MGDIKGALDGFLGAFSDLDLDGMMAYYAEDATTFLPIGHHSPRLEGREEIKEAFARVLSKIRASGATSIGLDAEDVRIQELGGVAVATFHVRDTELCRRSLVLRSTGGRWLIEHFHASNAPLPGGA